MKAEMEIKINNYFLCRLCFKTIHFSQIHICHLSLHFKKKTFSVPGIFPSRTRFYPLKITKKICTGNVGNFKKSQKFNLLKGQKWVFFFFLGLKKNFYMKFNLILKKTYSLKIKNSDFFTKRMAV